MLGVHNPYSSNQQLLAKIQFVRSEPKYEIHTVSINHEITAG